MSPEEPVSTRRGKRPESVLVLIHTADGEILLLRRADFPDFWQSVTGSLEWDAQDPGETARREVQEETGIVSSTGWRDWHETQEFEIFPQWRHRYGPGVTTNREHLFSLELAAPVNVVLNPAEHVAYRWLPVAQAAWLCRSWTNREALARLGRERGWLR